MSQWYGHPRVLGIPILKHLVIWASPVTLTQIAKVIWEGDAPITRVLGMERPKTRGCPCHCNTEDVDKRSGYEIGLFWKRYYKFKHNRQETGSKLISSPDLLFTKPKARSGRVRKFSSFLLSWLRANDVSVVSCARCGVCSLFFAKSFTEEVVFRLNITCKTHFKDCFELLARAMITKFKLTTALNLMFQTTTTTTN